MCDNIVRIVDLVLLLDPDARRYCSLRPEVRGINIARDRFVHIIHSKLATMDCEREAKPCCIRWRQFVYLLGHERTGSLIAVVQTRTENVMRYCVMIEPTSLLPYHRLKLAPKREFVTTWPGSLIG